MSGSPLQSFARTRGGPHAQRPRGRRRLRTLALLALAVAALALLVNLLLAGSASETHGATRRLRALARPAAPALSPAGLALARPAFALGGLGRRAAEPVRLAFRHPPRAGLLFDLDSGRVLWEREPLRRLPIASLTKMMTALLTVTSASGRRPVLITKHAVDAGGSMVGVLPRGRHVPLETLLYGLLLPSGNDAAVALAEALAGSVPAFVARMNHEAAALGLGCTRYSSPSGLIDRGNFSCAADLAVLAHEDLAQPRIAAATRTLEAVRPFPIRGGRLFLSNNNPLLIYHYPGATGLKTGYTEAAGRCLVGTAERDGVRLGAIVLNSHEPGRQVRALLNAGFEQVYGLASEREAEMPPGA